VAFSMAWADALFELADAVLCTEGPAKTLVGLWLAPEHQRGHGALYDAVNCGRVEVARLRRALAGLPLSRWDHGQIRPGVDVSPWLRPDAATSPDRLFCHVYGRGKGQAQMIRGWPYSVVAALESGRMSWTAVLNAVRLGPGDDQTEVTAAQVRDVVARLAARGTGADSGTSARRAPVPPVRQNRARAATRLQEPPPSQASRRGKEPRQAQSPRQRNEGDRLDGKLSWRAGNGVRCWR
jgi:DDE superfamily endonuclease